MCSNIVPLKTKKKSIVGYKFVIEKNRKYYSPATGIQYKGGKIPVVTKIKKRAIKFDLFNPNLLIPYTHLYKPAMRGFTAAFKDKTLAVEMARYFMDAASVYSKFEKLKYNPVVVKVKLYGTFKKGEYMSDPVVLADHMDVVKIVHTCDAIYSYMR